MNQILKDAAMANANRFYLVPDEDIKAYAKEQQEAYLASEVKYKITYMDAGLLSVAYDDHYFAGNYAAEFSALRTRVINLDTAEEYQVEDVVDGNDAFVKSCLLYTSQGEHRRSFRNQAFIEHRKEELKGE